MLADPKWKHVQKDKWISKKDFDLTTCYYRGKKVKDPWPMIPIGINIGDSYTDGFEVVGDLSKKRRKKLEISTTDFLTTVTPNHTSGRFYPPLNSTSVRTCKTTMFISREQAGNQKIYPKTLKHVTDCVEDNNEIEKPATITKPKIIRIQTAGMLTPLKESMLSGVLGSPNRMMTTGETTRRTAFKGFKKIKILRDPSREGYIKDTVKTYFG